MNYTLSAHSFNEPTLLAPYGASASAASAAVFAAREEEEGRKSVNARSDQIVENPRRVSAHLLSSWRRGGKKRGEGKMHPSEKRGSNCSVLGLLRSRMPSVSLRLAQSVSQSVSSF